MMDKYGDLLKSIEKFCFLVEAKKQKKVKKVFGPYANIKGSGRSIIILKYEDGSTKTMSYPRYVMEQHLGKPLDENMTVDHIDFDFNNNDISNLRLLPRSEHSKNDTRRVKLIKLKCAMCGKEFERSPRLLRDKTKKGNVSQFCSRSCSGSYTRKVQLGQMDALPVQPLIESEYYRLKNLDAAIYNSLVKYASELGLF